MKYVEKIKTLKTLKKYHLENISKCEKFLASVTADTKPNFIRNIEKCILYNKKAARHIQTQITLLNILKNAKFVYRRF